jgi:hypothetical protein
LLPAPHWNARFAEDRLQAASCSMQQVCRGVALTLWQGKATSGVPEERLQHSLGAKLQLALSSLPGKTPVQQALKGSGGLLLQGWKVTYPV